MAVADCVRRPRVPQDSLHRLHLLALRELVMLQLSRQAATFLRQATFCVAALALANVAWADSPRVLSVEEHWELRIAEPDPDTSAPQTTMVQTPDGDLDGVQFLFTINHGTVPDYQPGGLQVQLWENDELVESASAGEETLHHDQELVTWVQKLSLEDGTLKFQVHDGHSESWGDFGGEDLTLSTSTSLESLNGYRPGVSLTESQVNYAENRVVSLTLMKLVWITEDGEVHELNAPIAVDTSLDP
jgi:hypothetical protein